MPTDQRPLKQKLITNTKYNFFFMLLIFGSAFLLIPLQIKHLGFKPYSLLVLIGLVFSYLQLFDLGLETTVKKQMAEVSIKKDKKTFNQYLSNAIIIGFIITLAALLIVFLLFCFSKTLGFQIESRLINLFVQLLIISFLYIPFYNLFKFSEFSLRALQRDDLVFKANLPTYLIYTLGSFIILPKTKDPLIFFVFQKTVFLLVLVVQFFLLKKLVDLKFSFRFFNKTVIKKILRFAVNIQFIKIANFINEQTDKIFISYFLQSYLIGFYEIGLKLLVLAKNLPISLTSGLIPATSELSSLGKKEKILKLYIFLNKCLFFLIFPLFFFTIIFADKLIFLWLQEDFPMAYKMVWVLMPAFLVNGLAYVGAHTATGIGAPQIQTKVSLLQTFSNLLLTFVLIKKFGYWGAVTATAITFSATSLYFLLQIHKKLQLSNLFFFKTTVSSPLFATLFCSILICATQISIKTNNRVNTFLFLGINSLLFFSTYFLLMLLAGYFKNEDKEKLLFIKKSLVGKNSAFKFF